MVAIITRVVSCGIPANFFGISGIDSLSIGFGMVPRGEFAMIVACIGLQQGIIEQGNLSDPRHHEYDDDVIYPSCLSELAFPERKGLTRRVNIVE
jgi:Kef-type K+ transport system membrane component KefB